jgi:hypothetical protein
MTNYSPIETKIRQAVQCLEPDPDFSETLLKQIMEQPRRSAPEARPFQWLFSRPMWVGACSLLVVLMALALIGPSRALAFFQSLMVYLPGAGFVQNGDGTLYMAEPLVVKREGVTLTIDQVVADPEHTIVAYHFENLPQVTDGKGAACFYSDNKIRLPDGKVRLPIGGGVTGPQARIEYQPLPTGVTRFTLLVTKAGEEPGCTAPAEWTVDIALGTELPKEKLMPVYEGQAVQPPLKTENAAQPAAQPGREGIQLTVDRVADLEDGYMLSGHALWNSKDWENVSLFPNLASVTILDAEGREVAFEEAGNEIGDEGSFAYKIKGKNYRSPFVLKVGNFMVNGSPAAASSFSFEAGKAPKPDQSWELNQGLEIMGQKVIVRSVKAVQLDDSTTGKKIDGYAFEIQTPPSVHAVDFRYSGEQNVQEYFAQSKNLSGELQLLEMGFPQGRPDGRVSFRVSHLGYSLAGSWQVEWQIPAAPQP